MTPELLLAIVAMINAIGSVIALIIHALRVPYRESAATEQLQATDQMMRLSSRRRAADPTATTLVDREANIPSPTSATGTPST